MDEAWTDQERKAFGKRLQQARDARGLLQDDVGAAFDMTKQAISHWETGRNMPTVEQLARLASELNASVEWLLFGESAQPLTPDLRKVLSALSPEDLLRVENSLRVQQGMPLVESLPVTPRNGKRRAAGAA